MLSSGEGCEEVRLWLFDIRVTVLVQGCFRSFMLNDSISSELQRSRVHCS